jgi:hypothetical protein
MLGYSNNMADQGTAKAGASKPGTAASKPGTAASKTSDAPTGAKSGDKSKAAQIADRAKQAVKHFMTGGIAADAPAAVRTARVVKLLVILAGAFLIASVGAWALGKLRLNAQNCIALDALYDQAPPISSLKPGGAQAGYLFRDYYVKTAYNCCAAGAFKNDFVNICALKQCIAQGARCLDFEVYDIRGRPAIGVSTIDSNNIKECYNSVPFEEAMQTVANYAFSSGATACAGDPLVLHLRIMSGHKEIFDQMAETLYRTLEKRMLGNKYSYENYGHNLGAVKLSKLMGRVIIIVDRTNPLLTKTSLDEYTNMCSNATQMRALRYSQVRFSHDTEELTEFNKQHMTIVLPDLGTTPENPASPLPMSYGCQFVGMCFQNFDSNMEYNALFFDQNGSAFGLKPEHLRYVPLTIPVPPDPPADYSYGPRQTKTVAGLVFPT